MPDNGVGVRLWLGILGRFWFQVSHNDHGWSRLGATERTRFPSIEGWSSGGRRGLLLWVILDFREYKWGGKRLRKRERNIMMITNGLGLGHCLGAEKRLIFHQNKEEKVVADQWQASGLSLSRSPNVATSDRRGRAV